MVRNAAITSTVCGIRPKALEEAEGAGIHTFCVTVDRSGHDYLRRMCPEMCYMVIAETEGLPAALQKAYRQLIQI